VKTSRTRICILSYGNVVNPVVGLASQFEMLERLYSTGCLDDVVASMG